jgi:DNA-binding CsgD family transcriptional regulator
MWVASGDEALSAVIAQLGGSRLDPESVLRAILAALSKLRPVTWVALVMGKDPRTALVVAADDLDPQLAEYVEGMNPGSGAPTSSFSLEVIETGEPMLLPRVPYEEFVAMQTPDIVDYLGQRTLPLPAPIRHIGCVVVPMRARGATIGTLAIFDRQLDSALTEADVRWLQAIADRVAVLVESAQAQVAANTRLERLTALRSVALAVAGSRDLRLTLQVILDSSMTGLAVDAAAVLLLGAEDGMLRMASRTGFQTTSIPDYRLPVEEALPGPLILGQAAIAEGAPGESRRRTLFAREGFKARRAAPLMSQGLMTGVIEVFKRSQLKPDREWLDFLEALASEAAVAIDRAGALDRVERPTPGGVATTRTAPPELSRLEGRILALTVEGMSNQEIAEKVHLSQHTVKFHVRQILHKVGVANRTELARKATKEGWL